MEQTGNRSIPEYTERVKIFWLIPLLLLLEGCEQRADIYSRFLSPEKPWVECVDFNRTSPDARILARVLSGEGFDLREGCPEQVVVFKSFSACSASRESGGSRGFIRLKVSRDGRTFYQVQREFYDEPDEAVLRDLAARMATELIPVSR